MQITLIAAVAKNSIIGKDNTLPWNIPSDLQHFKNYTDGKMILMGKNTFLSLPTLLKNRCSIVLTSHEEEVQSKVDAFKQKHPNKEIPELLIANDLQMLFEADLDELCDESYKGELVVIGGASIYKQLMPYADNMVITFVDANVDGDTKFPLICKTQWELDTTKTVPMRKQQGDEYAYSIGYYSRIKKDNTYSFTEKRKMTKSETVLLSLI